jgi:GT2 family glycosyltransferase
MPSVDVSIVTWNSAAVLQDALVSVFAQTRKPDHVYITDNASTDGVREVLMKFPTCTVTYLQQNTGFAAAHNDALAQSTADYVLVMNPDVTLRPDYIEQLCAFAEEHPRAAAFVGAVLRPDGVPDTAGLYVAPWRIVKDLTDQPQAPRPVFGVSGALALYRRAALLDVARNGNIFNPMLFAYKEDVELAWRLRWAGWQHSRVMQHEVKRSRRAVDRRFLSYRNHLLLYSLVESRKTLLPDLWLVIPAELCRFIVLLLTDTRVTVRALAAAAKMWHAARTFASRERRTAHASQVRAAFRP